MSDEHNNDFGRFEIPRYIDRLPPCNQACPAGENIQKWLSYVREGAFEQAWKTIMASNPLPAVHGRVCYHPCESHCTRNDIDNTVSIHAIERFLGDEALKQGWKPDPVKTVSGKRVLVVGAGPCGLSAGYHLRLLGHEVVIKDAGPLPGGMMHFGIPAYRLPRDILDAEIKHITHIGVKLVMNHKVEHLEREMVEGDFDAAFVAIGAHISRNVDIPGRDVGAVLDAVSFLKAVEFGSPPLLGRKVAIYGGGNTAIDAARTAKRLGAEDTYIVYRRNAEKAPAHEFEITEALEEDIKIHWLRTIKEVDAQHLVVEKMKLDEHGWPQPTGELETLEADSLILALGQNVDARFLTEVPGVETKPDGTVVIDEQMMTGRPGIFAGGDMVPSKRTVTISTGHGKKAAHCIDAWLRQETYTKKSSSLPFSPELLHLWFYTDAAQKPEPVTPGKQRAQSFSEVHGGLSEQDILFEAKRCLSCGNCFECDGCLGSCPEDAVIKLGTGKRYRFDYDRCTGCGLCSEQCPCGAITMVPDNMNPSPP